MTRRIRKYDIVVLLRDDKQNGVPNFKQYIGATGLVKSTSRTVSRVAFSLLSLEDTWFYVNTKLEVIGDIR